MENTHLEDEVEECTLCENGIIDDLCGACNGSGEGMYDGSTCPVCKGSGSGFSYCDCELGREAEYNNAQ